MTRSPLVGLGQNALPGDDGRRDRRARYRDMTVFSPKLNQLSQVVNPEERHFAPLKGVPLSRLLVGARGSVCTGCQIHASQCVDFSV
jgi:hypothetical protein